MVDVARGDFAFIAGEMAKAGRLEIDTPVARIRGSTRVGGIGTLSLISLFFAAMEDVQAAPPDAARTEDEIIPVDYSGEPHGSFELTTKESVPRRIYVDDPGVTWALRLNSSSELSISSVANSPAQMAQLSAIQQGVLHTYSVGLQSMQGPTFNGQNGSTTNPSFEILPGNARPINFSSQPDAGGLQQNLNGSQQHPSLTQSRAGARATVVLFLVLTAIFSTTIALRYPTFLFHLRPHLRNRYRRRRRRLLRRSQRRRPRRITHPQLISVVPPQPIAR